MKNSSSETPLNILLIGIYVFAFLGIVLLLYGALPVLADVLMELKQGAAAKMYN